MGEVGEGQSRGKDIPHFSEQLRSLKKRQQRHQHHEREPKTPCFYLARGKKDLSDFFHRTRALGTSKHTNKLNIKYMLDLTSELCQDGRRKSRQSVVKTCLVLLDTKLKRNWANKSRFFFCQETAGEEKFSLLLIKGQAKGQNQNEKIEKRGKKTDLLHPTVKPTSNKTRSTHRFHLLLLDSYAK